MILKQMMSGLDAVLEHGSWDTEIKNIAYDSRKVEEGSLFVCIQGMAADGHTFIKEAVARGAVAVLVERFADATEQGSEGSFGKTEEVFTETGEEFCEASGDFSDVAATVVSVADTRKAAAQIASAFYGNPSEHLKVIGITGTKGKTTTAYMVRDILKKAGYKVGLLGTIDYEWGDGQVAAEMTTPEAMDIQKYLRQMVDEGCQYAVMEASSQGLKLHRLDGIQFDVGIFTNLGNDHISSMEHAGMEEYAACKAELFRRCRIGIGNLDDRWYERIVGQGSCEKLTFSCLQESDYQASWVTLLNKNGRLGTLFMVGNEEYQVSVPGVFSVYNALAAIAVCSYYGVPAHTINEALSEVNVSGRVEAVETSQRYRILIDYAHNALSLKNILTTMRRYHPYRLMVLFGCCGNLAVSKRREMGVTAGRYADFTVITSDNPRNENPETIMAEIEEGIRETGAEYVKIADRKEAIRYILEKAKTGDIVILAGKGHERYQEIGGEKVPFDEREIVREILGE